MEQEAILSLPKRRELLEILCDRGFPIHAGELANMLLVDESTVRYHLRVLEKMGFAESVFVQTRIVQNHRRLSLTRSYSITQRGIFWLRNSSLRDK